MFSWNVNNVYFIGFLIQIFLMAFDAQAAGQKSQDYTVKNINTARKIFNGMEVEDIIDLETTYNCLRPINYYKKNFTAAGRRISEVKCLEYVWDSRFAERAVDIEEWGSKIIPIVSGERAAFYGEFPHMGALGWRSAGNDSQWIFKCGATLISERFMLTAAHCSQAKRGDNTIANIYPEIVAIGDKFISNEISKSIIAIHIPIKTLIKYKDYKSPKHYYDIAIIELYIPVSIGSFIRPACLWSSPDMSDLDKLLVTGWGILGPVTKQTTNELQVAEVNLIGDETCDKKLYTKRNRNWGGLADHQICAGFLPGGVDTCEGDSGGPLNVKMNLTQKWPMYYLVGVTSFGYSCAVPDTPAVYVKISSFIDWIESIVWPDA